ncbi:glycosyltransferase [Pectinatus haikarae]|uniref:Glycosyltransferase involved in cell wall biosynthesis n=1 Tax=Pectinatus haikarae TaxID=349096 RepID=A0ABT9YBG5_9FIRM|nr:glycosyltransferase [Pectinatus haikarae]MDQ0205189.1 glycosyltransferase involved in cell wall biosynthesis [Pectinatus haikarae]
MDIGIVIPELKKYGGAEKLLIECLRRWQYEHNITVYAIAFNEKLLHEHHVTKIKKKILTSYFDGKHSMLLNSILLPKIWEKEIGRHEIYHTHLWPMHLLNLHPVVWYPHEPLRVINDLKYEQPVAMTALETSRNIHTYPKTTYDAVDIKAYMAYQAVIAAFDKIGKPDKIIANSKYTAGYLNRVYGVDNVGVVYPGINKEDFFYQPPDENIILCVNQLWPHKRVNLIIEAMQYVENSQLYIVGKGPEEKNLKEQAKELGLSDRVFFMGSVSNEELAILYARALCLAFASVREPFGIVALEAMAAGKPLIAVNEGGYCEAVDNSCAFLIDAMPQAFAEKINYLIDNKDVATKMGLAGKAKLDNFTWQKTADGIMDEIKRVYADKVSKQMELQDESLLVGIEYYVWYGKGFGASHWNDNKQTGVVTQKPLLGYYSSDSGEIIRRHLTMLEKSGIDYVSVNIHIDERGIDVYQYNVVERILDIMADDNYKIKLCLQICPFTTSSEKLLNSIKKLIEKFLQYKSYQQYKNKPLMYIFWTGSLDGDYDLLNKIRHLLSNVLVIASSLRLYNKTDEYNKTYGLFDGWSLFSPLEVANDDEKRKILIKDTYQQYEAGNKQIKVFTCSPGYDDRGLEDPGREKNHLRYIDRKNGDIFRDMLQMALECYPTPDIIKISTFNEYHENTHTEPTVAEGDLYIKLLRKYISKLKRK